MAAEDITVKTSLIETRFLIGDSDKYEKFCTAVRKNVLKKNTLEFLDSKLQEKHKRYGGDARVGVNPEPNVKEGPGGLRDYHTALWATAVRFGCFSFREMELDQVISQQELDTLYESVDFSLRVRNELHYLTGKKADMLALELQKDLAVNLGYGSDNAVQAVETFMRDYFLHATNIFNISHAIFELCLHSTRSFKKVISSLKKKSLGQGFHADGSTLVFEGDAPKAFEQDRTLLLKVFDLCRKFGLEIDFQLKRQVRRYREFLDESFLTPKAAKDFLFTVLDDSRSEQTLRLMHETEVLGQILPHFGRAHCQVSYDFYHRYTADEHSLRMVRFLEELLLMENPGVEELARVYEALPRRTLLKFSALLQSIGKNRESFSLKEKRELLGGITDRLGLDFAEKKIVRFLIENMYEMVETALHQDMHQPATIRHFAQKVGTRERLDLLYLFSYAELRAVAPGTWTAWKKMLLSELYHRTRQFLEHPEAVAEKPHATREEVYKALHWECPPGEIEHHLNDMPEDYLMTVSPEEAALHLRMIRARKEHPWIMNHQYIEEGKFHQLTLCCRSEGEAFSKLMGTLTSKNINISGAQIYLKKDGNVLISVQVEDTERLGPDNGDIWEDVKQTLGDVLENRKDLRTLLAQRTRYVVPKTAPRPIVPRIQMETPPDSKFSVVRIEARDHLGMLYKIARTFADFNIQVHRAKISTQGDRGIDVFYVTLRDQKLTFPRLIRRIKEKLIHVLLIDNPEDVF